MANKMLIDATHGEETRVVVVRGNKVEEFDFESSHRKQLRGNIYLAKVTRVEPSLQAAFVEYGGNRHGFLAFSEIHPDYYQIPVADRQALLDEEQFSGDGEDFEEEREQRPRRRPRRNGRAQASSRIPDEAVASEDVAGEDEAPELTEGIPASAAEGSNGVASDEDDNNELHADDNSDEAIESIGSGEALEDMPRRSPRRTRQYKIQEVIKRRQIILVQVVKEERGNKGAALTTYLSLAGRYSVLMPNTARGGGISRKITSAQDRTRLKEIVEELEVPEGMGVILRTAGANRTKLEVKRDFEYLLRLWETVRETTLVSSAPTLVYEEGNLVKRVIRDLYNKDIDEVIVSGDAGYREAKDFMRMLMPSHARNVQLYRDSVPVFTRYGVESQLDAMFSNEVTLRSGGYIVINQTEALVAIDVNSGRSTREHNIEDTALKTNLEAAEEIARQLRLRDLAGLIVCDFIDMEEKRNNRAVEKRMKECLKNDRARIQVGHISHFGLMEMSRQRIRTGVLESSTEKCPLCSGTGMIRSIPSVALNVLRNVEDYLLRNNGYHLNVRTHTAVALYILNQKRQHVLDIEKRFGVSILFSADETLPPSEFLAIQKGEAANPEDLQRAASARLESAAAAPDNDDDDLPMDEEAGDQEHESHIPSEMQGEDDGQRKRRRRRRRRGGRNGSVMQTEEGSAADTDSEDAESNVAVELDNEAETLSDTAPQSEETKTRRPRRRARSAKASPLAASTGDEQQTNSETSLTEAGTVAQSQEPSSSAEKAEKPTRRRTPRRRLPEVVPEAEASEAQPSQDAPSSTGRSHPPRRTRNQGGKNAEVESSRPADSEPSAAPVTAPANIETQSVEEVTAHAPAETAIIDEQRPRRSGWWQRRIFGGN
jgi:ribonuclease E